MIVINGSAETKFKGLENVIKDISVFVNAV